MFIADSSTSPKRVLHFLESGGLYGAESVVLNLSREMQKTSDYVPVVACIVQRDSDRVALVEKAREYDIEAHTLVVNNIKFPVGILMFLFWVRKFKIDLIHSHGYKASIISFFAMVFLRKPVLPTCHLWFWSQDAPLKFRVMTAIEIYLYRFFRTITVVSQPIKQTLSERGVQSGKIQIIKNGINLEEYLFIEVAVCDQIRSRLNLDPEVPVILNLGRLTEQKAQINIIRAAKIMKSRNRKFVVLIVGDGELRDVLERTVEEWGLKNEVRLLGFRDDARVLLKISSVFLLPSLDEGLPMALLEAMASRVPVIATGVGDIPKLLDSGRIGIQIEKNNIIDIVDSVEFVLENGPKVKENIERSYNKIKMEFSSATMFNRYKEIYKELLRG